MDLQSAVLLAKPLLISHQVKRIFRPNYFHSEDSKEASASNRFESNGTNFCVNRLPKTQFHPDCESTNNELDKFSSMVSQLSSNGEWRGGGSSMGLQWWLNHQIWWCSEDGGLEVMMKTSLKSSLISSIAFNWMMAGGGWPAVKKMIRKTFSHCFLNLLEAFLEQTHLNVDQWSSIVTATAASPKFTESTSTNIWPLGPLECKCIDHQQKQRSPSQE